MVANITTIARALIVVREAAPSPDGKTVLYADEERREIEIYHAPKPEALDIAVFELCSELAEQWGGAETTVIAKLKTTLGVHHGMEREVVIKYRQPRQPHYVEPPRQTPEDIYGLNPRLGAEVAIRNGTAPRFCPNCGKGGVMLGWCLCRTCGNLLPDDITDNIARTFNKGLGAGQKEHIAAVLSGLEWLKSQGEGGQINAL